MGSYAIQNGRPGFSMKKFATLFATSALMLVGTLVAPAAQADPYPQSVATTCTATTNSPVTEGQTVRIRVEWTSAGNATPRGDVQVNVISKKDDEIVRSVERYYAGKPLTFKFKGLKAGGYQVRIAATTPATSGFKSYRTRTFVRVTR